MATTPNSPHKAQSAIEVEMRRLSKALRQRQGAKDRYEESLEVLRERRDRQSQRYDGQIERALNRMFSLAQPNKDYFVGKGVKSVDLASGSKFGWRKTTGLAFREEDKNLIVQLLEGLGHYDCIKVEKTPLKMQMRSKKESLKGSPLLNFYVGENFWVQPEGVEEPISRPVDSFPTSGVEVA